jgi:competence protein CoiA
MLTSIRKLNSSKVIACDAEKKQGPFLCPECRSETILKKGGIKIPHFAHKPPFNCRYGIGEKEIHRKAKNEIYRELLSSKVVDFCELEYELKDVRPDIYFEMSKTKFAIEVQVSNFTINDIIRRTEKYCKLGVYVLWLPLYNDRLKTKRYTPNSWEKWLHALNFGTVFYWKEKLKITPVKYGPYKLYVEESTWYENGYERSEGGYERISKRYRTPIILIDLDLLKNFYPKSRDKWVGGDIEIPKSKILLNRN